MSNSLHRDIFVYILTAYDRIEKDVKKHSSYNDESILWQNPGY